MDYVVGGVAALISGNVTPNRPKLLKRALTPIKHQPSPNVTPKSEMVDDRSIFLSPSVQKKKAIVKKSPKRIFENPDLDITCDSENKSSPKADKVKKHLQEDLEDDNHNNSNEIKLPKKKELKDDDHNNCTKTKSPKKMKGKLDNSPDCKEFVDENESPQSANENTPKKKKKRHVIDTELTSDIDLETKKKKAKEICETINEEQEEHVMKRNIKKIVPQEIDTECIKSSENMDNQTKKKKKIKKKSSIENDKIKTETLQLENKSIIPLITETGRKKSKNKVKNFVNPNAITNEDTESEHESDDEILSENEEANKEILKTEMADESSDEEDEEAPKAKKVEHKDKTTEKMTQDEIKRTLFVGNVPFSKRCKKNIKKIFSKYGAIETVRIRTVPVKDARVTPKLAIIKNELHPERSTVHVYVKFRDASSVEKALVENNTVIDDCHLRVSRSDSTGAEHDPRNAVFVGNVPFALEDEALREKFAKCGDIESVRIIRDKRTNAGKGFAYVNFASKDGVELALAMSEEDLTIKNRILRVKRCTQTNKKSNQRPSSNINVKNEGYVQGKNQGMRGKKFGGKGFKQWGQQDKQSEGAERRIMHKRKIQESGDGPDGKRTKHIHQPQKEKKTRKEFVGMTAEKKKKHTFNKGMKKKKALSEILTKYQ